MTLKVTDLNCTPYRSKRIKTAKHAAPRATAAGPRCVTIQLRGTKRQMPLPHSRTDARPRRVPRKKAGSRPIRPKVHQSRPKRREELRPPPGQTPIKPHQDCRLKRQQSVIKQNNLRPIRRPRFIRAHCSARMGISAFCRWCRHKDALGLQISTKLQKVF